MKKTLLIILALFFFQNLIAETIVFKNCSSDDYKYEKNDYILDLKRELMTREFIYSEDSYEKLRLNDITVKKEKSLKWEDINLELCKLYPKFHKFSAF